MEDPAGAVERDRFGTVVRGKGGDSMDVRRIGKRGGAFETLSCLEGQQPGDAAKSIEGWVVFVAGLPPETTETDLCDVFAPFGALRNVKMNLDHRDCRCVGHAMIEFAAREECVKAVVALNHQPFLSARELLLSPAFLVPSDAPQAQDDEDDGSVKRKR